MIGSQKQMATFSLSLLRSNEISRLQNVSPYVSLKGPLVRSYDICLHVSRFTQFFSLLLLTFSINCYVRTIVSLPSVSLYVTSSQRFSVRKQVRRFISLAFSTFVCTLARSHDIVLLFLRFSVCQYIRTISRHCLVFLCTLVCSYGISLVFSTFIRTLVRFQLSHLRFSVIYCPTVIVQFVRSAFFRTSHTFLRNQFCLITFLLKLVVAYFISLCILVRWQRFSLLQCICNQRV